MEKQKVVTKERYKLVIISSLYVATMIIMFLGIYFSVYSLINKISFLVLNAQVPGAVFGMLVFYFGLRYFFSVEKLKTEIYKNTSRFSWSNFKKVKSYKHHY